MKRQFCVDSRSYSSYGSAQNNSYNHCVGISRFLSAFYIEIDASSFGIRVVLRQGKHPLAFFIKSLGPRWQKLSVYEKELLAVVQAVQKWEQYLCGQPFIIITDKKSLKWLLERKISSSFPTILAIQTYGIPICD